MCVHGCPSLYASLRWPHTNMCIALCTSTDSVSPCSMVSQRLRSPGIEPSLSIKSRSLCLVSYCPLYLCCNMDRPLQIRLWCHLVQRDVIREEGYSVCSRHLLGPIKVMPIIGACFFHAVMTSLFYSAICYMYVCCVRSPYF